MSARFRLALPLAVSLSASLLGALPAQAFCGFYVGKADTQLFNESSQVVLARDGDRTVITMSNDFKGELTEFALVVPVPTVLAKEQIHIGDRTVLEHLDAYSSPRLVEYFDANPCQREEKDDTTKMRRSEMPSAPMSTSAPGRAKALGVTVEAQYTVGEYDILMLSATESSGLETWLRENGYRIPPKASAALTPYIRQDMKFFVAKVNLKAQKATGFQHLRPIQIAYESKKFMLPIRLGMANSHGTQDLVIFALTRKGRVEATNYRTTFMPTGQNIPDYVGKEFGAFYRAAFDTGYRKADGRALFTEYAWPIGTQQFCDPCSAPPFAATELRSLGTFWRIADANAPTYLTRMHVRYDAAHFPEDLVFQETGDMRQFQARYVMQHAYRGTESCSEMGPYREQVRAREETEAKTLASLTGWSPGKIRQQMGLQPASADPWYKSIWK